jgi:hypothetical protein
LRREGFADGPADAAGAAGYDCYFAGEVEHGS